MITDNIKNISLYFDNFYFLEKAYEFISDNINGLSPEKKYLISNDMYAIVETSHPKPLNEQKLEIHRKYIDLQYIIKDYDIIGWKSLNNCEDIYINYDLQKDIAFYNDKPDFNIRLNEGHFALFFPGDAHAPLCGDISVKKCIIKADKTMKKLLLPLILCLTFPIISDAAFSKSDLGTKAAAFLKMPVGARAIGMGNAYTSVVNAASDMMYWNPAGIASIVKKDISFMYSSSFEDIAYEWASFALPTEYGVFGIAIQHLSYGDMDETDGNGNLTGGTFSPYDLAIYLSYARTAFFDNYGILDYGVNLKYIYSKIDVSASAVAFDAGAIYTLKDDTTSFGLVVQNVGTDMKYNNDSEALPVMFKLGASKRFFDALLLSADINFPSDNDIFPGMGAEYELKVNEEANISLRIGYDGKQKDIPGTGGLNAGFGVKFRDYIFDYAFSPSGDLGEAHRASLGIKFGYDITQEKPEKEIKEKPKKSIKEKIFSSSSKQESSAPQPKKAVQEEKSSYTMPVSSDEEDDDNERYGFRSDVYEEEAETRRENENAGVVAVMDLHSGKLPESEVNAYSQMLRKSVSENGDFRALDKVEMQQSYPSGAAFDEKAAKKVLKDTDADIVISGTVEKQSGKLHFDLNVYEKNKQVKNYKIVTEDSFRDAQRKLGSFAESLEKAQ